MMVSSELLDILVRLVARVPARAVCREHGGGRWRLFHRRFLLRWRGMCGGLRRGVYAAHCSGVPLIFISES